METNPIIKIEQLEKSFGDLHVLKGINLPRIFPLPILQSEQGVLASFQEIIAKIACVQRKDTAYFLRLIQLVSMLYDCRNIIALCALKTNITQNMGRPHCAATLILILL